jgi:hypothetical protein
VYPSVFNDSAGGIVSVDDDLHSLIGWGAWTTCEVVAGYLFDIIAMTSIGTPHCCGFTLFAKVDALKGCASSEGIVANVTDGGRDVDLLEVGCTLKGTTGDAATVGMDGV